MKICVLSDAGIPTSWDFPGHGLGKMALGLAEGLAGVGHDVVLYGAPESHSDVVEVREWVNEVKFEGDVSAFDAFVDFTHYHRLQYRADMVGKAVLNVANDREGYPGRNAIFVSEELKRSLNRTYAKPARWGRVIRNAIQFDDSDVKAEEGGYFLYMAHFAKGKAPMMAWNAARLAGERIVFAGYSMPKFPSPIGVEYVGPIAGEDKRDMLRGAKALVYMCGHECGPVAVIEAQALGVPVIVSAFGGSPEYMADEETGFVARDTLELAEKMRRIGEIDRASCAKWVRDKFDYNTMIKKYDAAIHDAVDGEVW